MKTTKIRQSAKGRDCTLRISGYQGCASNETTVLAHAPCRDDGRGYKSPDKWGAFACFNCHTLIDSDKISIHEKREAWLRGIYETQKILGVFAS